MGFLSMVNGLMAIDKPQPLPESREPPAGRRLDSWKEIATYLKRDESTVRRWEKEGLPVHRRAHKRKASVYAYESEIDAWWNDGRTRLEVIDRKSTRLNSSHLGISYAVFCLN